MRGSWLSMEHTWRHAVAATCGLARDSPSVRAGLTERDGNHWHSCNSAAIGPLTTACNGLTIRLMWNVALPGLTISLS